MKPTYMDVVSPVFAYMQKGYVVTRAKTVVEGICAAYSLLVYLCLLFKI